MKIEPKRSKRSVRRITTLAAFGLIILFGPPHNTLAQWATNGNDINNTNTGNVGIGTTLPAYKLDLSTSMDKAQIRFGMGASDTGGYLFSSGPSHATLSAGASWNGGWIARSLSASLFEASMGQLMFYANSGISTGSPFTPTERMRITSNGWVGIGTTSPMNVLTVSGADSNTTLGYNAVARLINSDTAANTSTALKFSTADSVGAIISAGMMGTVNTNHTQGSVAGDLFFSTATSSSLSEKMRITAGGNVGIGSTTPGYKLDVAGQVRSSSGGFVFPDGTLQATGATGIFKNVANAAGVAQFSAGSNNDSLRFEGTGGTSVSFDVATKKVIISGSGSSGTSGWTDGGATVSLTNSSANVGVGTSTPAAKLNVVGASGPQDHSGTAAPDALQVLGGTGGNGAGAGPGGIGGGIALTGGTGGNPYLGSQSALGGTGGGINITGGTGGPNLFNVGGGKGGNVLINGGPGVANSDGNILLGNLRGNVGIGMSNPGFRLDVNGEINATGVRINGAPISTGGSSQWTTAGSSVYYMSNVGIGTSNPGVALEVAQNKAIRLGNANISSGGDYVHIANHAWYNGSAWQLDGTVGGLYQISGQNHSWYKHDGSGAFTSMMTINPSGNVGIANANPTEKLDINGNIKLTGTGNITAAGTITGGTINAKYQDVAEWVESSQSLPAGTIVVLDHTKSNQVVASTQAYDTRVAGVISAQPGITLGESGAAKVLVATTGRVRIKVDATRAPIQVGDLLVTGDREGFAMKSVPVDIGGVQLHRPGTLVGKALEPLAKGTGEILVLLSLQ